jgi:multimeric flavodoxin WrbA
MKKLSFGLTDYSKVTELRARAIRFVNDDMAGAEKKVFNLNELGIRGCQACYKCQTPEGRCVQTDAMAPLYDEIYSSDAVVIGSPIYIVQVTGQTKIFIDRLFAFLYQKDGKPGNFRNKLAGKKAVTVFSHGQPDSNLFTSHFDLTEGVLAFLGFKVQERIVAGGMRGENDAKGNTALLEKAYAAGVGLTK